MLQYYYNMAIKGKEGERLREKEQKWRQKRFFWKEKEKRNEISEGEKKKKSYVWVKGMQSPN